MPEQRTEWIPTANGPHQGLRCLLLGINGAGMTAAAEILRDAGHVVFGMDAGDPEPVSQGSVEQSGKLLRWHQDAIPADLDVCIATRAVPQEHPLTRRLLGSGVPVISLPTFLAQIFSKHKQVCVAGTHGKSTTSAMLTWILEQAGLQPGCFVGAHQLSLSCSGRFRAAALQCGSPIQRSSLTDSNSQTDHAVLESCEFSRSFVEFSPSVAVVTGIERDHFDCFPIEADENDAFDAFVARIHPEGTLVYRSDCRRSVHVAGRFSGAAVSILTTPSHASYDGSQPDWQVRHPVASGVGTRSSILHRGRQYQLRLSVPGQHNIQNAVAAIAAADALGVDPNVCCRALSSFQGIRRRFEFRGHYAGITLIDDYAHHPTAIRETLRSAREAFPGRRIVVAFEPHQVGRTAALFADFVKSLALADEILILPVFPAREQVSHLDCCRASGRLVKELNYGGSKAFLFANLDQIVSRIDHSGRPTDVFVTMGAGRINLIHDELTRRLQRNSVA